MKKMFLLLAVFCMAFSLSACSSDSDDNTGGKAASTEGITVSTEQLSFAGSGGSQSVSLKTNHEWGAIAADKWVHLSPTGSVDRETTLTVSADENTSAEARDSKVTIMAGSGRFYINVHQDAGADGDSLKCPVGSEYKLVWHDEFDKGTELDSKYWKHEVKDPGWVNSELQYYVDHQIDGNNVTEIKKGKLLINCLKYKGNVYSARVYANMDTGYKYGYFEAKIKLPKGKGTWPAWWMMPANNDYTSNPWPHCGEIDIMEEVGVVPNEVSCTVHTTKYNNGNTPTEHWAKNIGTAESDFHTYALEWTPDYLQFYCDGQPTLKYTKDGTGKDQWPFDVPFYPILNLAWGGSWGGMNGVDESVLPCQMQVEYVRIYQK